MIRHCANCGAVLFDQWWDYDRRGFDCRACHALTGSDGALLAGPSERPKGTIRSRGWLFVVLIVLAIVAIFVAQQLG